MKNGMTVVEWALLFTLSVLWGGSFFFAEIALTQLTPLTLAFLRVSLGAAILFIGVKLSGHALPRSPQMWRDFFVMGLFGNALPFSLIYFGQSSISGGLAAILNSTTPFFTILLAHMFTADEKISAGKLAGIGLGVAGVSLIAAPDVLHGTGPVLPQLAILGASLCYAITGVYGRRMTQVPLTVSAAAQLTAASLLIAPIALILEAPFETAVPGPKVWAAVAALAVFSTALSYILYLSILRTAGATNVGLVTILAPVSAILLGAVFLGERLALNHLVGLLVIGLGLAVLSLTRDMICSTGRLLVGQKGFPVDRLEK